MPRLDTQLAILARHAIDLTRAGEIVRSGASPGSVPWNEWRVSRLEDLYELAYLRVFIAWELFLESTFFRYLCGYRSRHGMATPVTGSYYPTVQSAETAVLAGNQYLLWHNPNKVVARCRSHMTLCFHELVFVSNLARLQCFADVRHRIAHGQKDAKNKFDTATMQLSGQRYLGAKAGRFLRDWSPGTSPRVRWIHSITQELIGLAGQIV